MRDEYIPYMRKMDFYAPFPPLKSKFWRKIRPLLCALRIFRPGRYSITLREMDLDRFFDYSSMQIQEIEEVLGGLENKSADFWQSLKDGYGVGLRIEKKKPEKFVIATGLDDAEWFSSLQPSERRRLEEAIDQVNPELKKKLMPVMEAVTRTLLQLTGLESSTSSSQEATDQRMD